MKECNRCHEIKPKTEFHKRGNSIQHICKSCKSKEDKKIYQINITRKIVNVSKKICNACKIEKDISCFYKQRSQRDGHSSHCKECELDRKQNGAKIISSEWWKEENKKKCRITALKKKSKRRKLGSILLNEWQENFDGHHIDKKHIIYIPKELHRSIQHNVWTGKNMEAINELAFKFL